jgi:hypothetical protein
VLLELGSNVKSFTKGAFWSGIESKATIVKEPFRAGATLRSIDEEGMVLYITARGGKASGKHHGVSWAEVKGAFQKVTTEKQLKTKYEMGLQAGKQYVKVCD